MYPPLVRGFSLDDVCYLSEILLSCGCPVMCEWLLLLVTADDLWVLGGELWSTASSLWSFVRTEVSGYLYRAHFRWRFATKPPYPEWAYGDLFGKHGRYYDLQDALLDRPRKP